MADSPILFMLIGLPGSGKSTWRSTYLASAARPAVTVSSDDMIEQFGAKQGLTYSQAWDMVDFKAIDRQVHELFVNALGQGEDIILDRTNMSVKSRNRFLSKVPSHYEKVAIVFDVDDAILHERLTKRAEQTGKVIPPAVVATMKASYAAPTEAEFHRIVTIRH